MSAQKRRIEAGAEALMTAYPVLLDDFTEAWFLAAAEVVLSAVERHDEDRPVVVEFADPPQLSGLWSSAAKREAEQFAEVLREKPNRWAIYPWTPSGEAARATAARISRGSLKVFANGFRAVSRDGIVYIRYEGGS